VNAALANCDKWPAAYAAWLVFERFTGASVTVQVASAAVNDAVNLACRTGQPNDIITATCLAYLKAQADAQAAKAAQPAPPPTQLVFCTRVHWGGRDGCSASLHALRSNLVSR
jgi:hypothetical protein